MKIDSDKLIEHLKAKWGDERPCPMCGNTQWEVQDTLFQISSLTVGYIQVGGPVMPIAPISCKNCGNTMLINALAAGLTTHPELESSTAEIPDE